MNPVPLRLRPIGLSLLAALLFHGLVLARLQLQRQRQLSATADALDRARPLDDTPELLRLSRHRAEVATPAIVPLPGFEQLPPPPPPLAAPRTRAGGAAKSLDASAVKARRLELAGGSHRPVDGAGRGAPGRLQARPGSALGGKVGPAREVETPAQLLERLRRLALAPSEARPGAIPSSGVDAAGGADGAEPLLRRPEGLAQQPYLELWESARPQSVAPAGFGILPAALERRSLPLIQARRSGLAINHGAGVLLGDQLLLFWIQSDQLWLLRETLSGG